VRVVVRRGSGECPGRVGGVAASGVGVVGTTHNVPSDTEVSTESAIITTVSPEVVEEAVVVVVAVVDDDAVAGEAHILGSVVVGTDRNLGLRETGVTVTRWRAGDVRCNDEVDDEVGLHDCTCGTIPVAAWLNALRFDTRRVGDRG
jgi:hypothetical protein